MNSQFFQAVADLLRHIESLNAPANEYAILDGGGTLECSSWLHEQIKETACFKTFESVGGSWYCYDDLEWIAQTEGVSASTIAVLFEASTTLSFNTERPALSEVDGSRGVEVS